MRMRKPKLLPDWKRLIREAWSIKMILIGGIWTGVETVVAATGVNWIPAPMWARMLILFLVFGGAFVARLLAQRETQDDR